MAEQVNKRVGRNVKISGYNNRTRQADKIRKHEEAEKRNEAWRKLSPQQQLDVLDKGGLVATKQRARIQKTLDAVK
jgi:hypothetical protein